MTDRKIILPDEASAFDQETEAKRTDIAARLERLKRRVNIVEEATEAVDISRSVLEKTVEGMNRKQRRAHAARLRKLK